MGITAPFGEVNELMYVKPFSTVPGPEVLFRCVLSSAMLIIIILVIISLSSLYS